MYIKVINSDYESVMNIKKGKHKNPKRPNMFFRALMRLVSIPDLAKTKFKYERVGMDRLGRGEPAFYLMNHSSFIDLEIIARILFPRPFNIVTTTDAFIGKGWLLRAIGCIPTRKFVHDPLLVRDIKYSLNKLKSNVILFPEAGYSFDGTSTTIPDTVAKLIKMLKVPLIMIRTYGAFARDPLYNNIQVRDVQVSAREEYLLSPEEIEAMSVEDINKIVTERFSFDNFKWQQENGIVIDEPTRADYLNRVLYKCPACGKEGDMTGKGVSIKCNSCGKAHILNEYGYLEAEDGNPSFTHIPDWYRWERECVRAEIERGEYSLDLPVNIMMTVDTNRLYRVGDGRLTHGMDGFVLDGCDGNLHYVHKAFCSYTLNSDFNWYEIGDMISIGNHEALYYCFPKTERDVVAKARLATEEIFKILREKKRT